MNETGDTLGRRVAQHYTLYTVQPIGVRCGTHGVASLFSYTGDVCTGDVCKK